MPSSITQPAASPALVAGTALIVESFARLLQRQLLAATEADVFTALWSAPRVVLAHGTQADPIFFYGNRMALELFEMDFASFTQLPSRFSAEPMERDARERFLQQVNRDGYIDDYAGVRVSSTGKRFLIQQAVVWNLADRSGVVHGQAATFESWKVL